jgi:spore germination cell wall hydrolase CwlJ-like protein
MSKRSELKKRNAELYLKKNILSGKYVVRNILVGTIAVAVTATGVGVVGAVEDKIQTRPAKSEVEAKETVDTDVTAEISFGMIPQLDSSSISVLLSDMDDNGNIYIESREKNLVTYAPGEFDKKFVGIEDDVNVHTEASEDAQVVGRINKGVVGDIVSSDGEWVSILSGDVTGYVEAEYLLSGDEAAEYAADYYTAVGTVNDDGVYVRSEASKESDYVATADLGDTYEVEDLSTVDTEWVCVQVNEDITGYIYSDFVDVEAGYPEAVAVGVLPEATGSISEVKKAEKEEATGNITETKNDNKKDDNKQAATTEATTAATTAAAITEAPTTAATTEAANNQAQVTTTARGSISLTESDINLMAAVLTFECGGESYEGQLAVANVILNRLQSGAYGSTVSDVVYSPNQFSVVGTGAFNSCVANGTAQSSCVQAVREACAGTNNIGSYKYFRTTSSANVSSYSSYVVIGNHVFY